MASDKAFDIFYTAYSGRPPVDSYLHIFPDGRAELYLGTYASLPGTKSDQVGFFGMSVPQNTLVALNTFLLQEKFSSRSGANLPSGAIIRGVTLTLGGQQTQLVMPADGRDKAFAKLEKMLMEIMVETAKRPMRAVQVALALSADGPNLRPELTVTNVGTDPLAIVLFDPTDEGTYLAVEFNFAQPGQWYDPVTTLRDDIAALVAAGKLPSGLQSLAAGDFYQFTLPAFTSPSNDATLQVMSNIRFWLPGAGSQLHEAQVQTTPIPVTSAKSDNRAGRENRPLPLQLSITSTKQSYRLDETIYVTVALRNMGATPLTVNGRLLLNRETAPESVRDLSFEIRGPVGYSNQRLFRVNAGAPTEQDLVKLEAGGVQQRSIELTRFHSLHLPGQYTVIAHYLSVTSVTGFDVWQGALQSPPLVLERR